MRVFFSFSDELPLASYARVLLWSVSKRVFVFHSMSPNNCGHWRGGFLFPPELLVLLRGLIKCVNSVFEESRHFQSKIRCSLFWVFWLCSGVCRGLCGFCHERWAMSLRNDSLLCVLALFRGFNSCVNYLMNEGRCRWGMIGCCVCLFFRFCSGV